MQQDRERAAEKAAWRERFHARRAAMPVAARAEASAAIVAAVDALLGEAGTVSVFWPLVARGEVDVRPLIATLLERGATVALPVVASREPPRLVHRRLTSEADLVDAPFGLREPAATCPEVHAFDAVVVPALGIARDGTRLGYGGGYYDAFLAQTPARRLGVVWHACLVDILPAGPLDARLDAVVSERETVWTGRTPSRLS